MTRSHLSPSTDRSAQDGVVHLIAERLWKPAFAVELPEIGSRDFH